MRVVLVVVVLLVIGAPLILRYGAGLHRLESGGAPLPLPASGFPHDALRPALRYAGADGFDHGALARDRSALDRYVATLAAVGPASTPARFPSRDAELAYWLNAYNALVLFAVAEEGLSESVHEVPSPLVPRPGFGFFVGVRVRLDGRWRHLYGLEHDTIRPYGDARIHAALNCASVSCPPLSAQPFLPETLDEQLDAVTSAFCSAAPHVAFDPQARRVTLSSIFDWFAGDFEQHAARLQRPADVLAFIEHFAEPSVAALARQARREGWQRSFVAYDWRLNTPGRPR